ncbi:Hypothetical predicted protein [Cloeon dipterum]|uniref:Uncharacterized protein n=1 Tax=Cloeon dipterum TaxID=197152 RepID=A0A8S1CTZ7_9INSE|nr:Hypothetical predicted protein [Cloeon dipterum]
MSLNEQRPSRKRSLQDCDDGACDFVPLSKRINNLHLTRPVIGDEALQGAQKVEAHHNHHHDLPAPHQHNGHSSNGFMNGVNGHNGLPESNQYQQQPSPGPSTVAPWVTDQMMAQYAPQIEQTAEEPSKQTLILNQSHSVKMMSF